MSHYPRVAEVGSCLPEPAALLSYLIPLYAFLFLAVL
jgi:hypothetical protein